MKNARVLNVFSLIFNAAIVGFVAFLFATFLLKEMPSTLLYFADLSALLVALAALICIPFNVIGIVKQKRLPVAAYVCKLLGTTSAVTALLVSVLILAKTDSGWDIAGQFGNFDFKNVNFYVILIAPVLSLISFIFFDHTEKAKLPVVFIAFLPALLFNAFYLVNSFAKFVTMKIGDAETYDWYGFFTNRSQAIAILLIVGVIVGALVVAIILYLLNRLLSKAFFGNEAQQAEEPVKVTYPEEEQAPATEEEPAEEEVVEEPVAEPQEEAEPEESNEEPDEEPQQEEPEPEEPKEEKKPAKAIRVGKAESSAPAKKPAEQKQEAVPAKKPTPAKPAPAPAKPAPAPAKEEKKAEPAKEPVKEEKKAPAKKAAQPASAKEEKKPAAAKKPAPAKEEAPAQTKVYHLTKRKEDGMWAITFVGGQKAVKLFKTKKEAEAALKVLTENQGATALIRNSKGAKAGKFASSIKASEEDKK